MKSLYLFLALLSSFAAFGQQIKIESDDNIDRSRYKTFRFGEGQITTPKDERVMPDTMVHRWMKEAIMEELSEKGLRRTDSSDVVVSYLIGSEKRLEAQHIGPLGQTPGSNVDTYTRDYQSGTIVIDVNDSKNNKLVWRINAVTNTNQQDGEKMIHEIIEKGFKKFSIRHKKHK